jgi:hypothetical protein
LISACAARNLLGVALAHERFGGGERAGFDAGGVELGERDLRWA